MERELVVQAEDRRRHRRRGAKLPKQGCAGAIDALNTAISLAFERSLVP
jgi:hypothetical protein